MDCNVDPKAPSLFEPQEPKPSNERYERDSKYHGLHLSSTLYKFQQEDSLCDITITVGGKSFHAHKVVLAATSRYFESMLTSGFKESTQSEIKIDGNSYAFGKLLEFAYSGDLKLSREIVIEVLKLACYMQFNKPVQLCAKFLLGSLNTKKVTFEDAFLIAMFAEPHGKDLQELCTFALKVVALGFHKFVKTRTFLKDATAEFLEKFLEKPDLARSTKEGGILSGVINWLSRDWKNRQQHATKLLQKLRLGVIPLEKLRKVLDFVQKQNMTECKEILDCVVELHSSKVKPSNTLPVSYEQRWFTARNMLTAPFAVGGVEKNKVQYFERSEQKWVSLRTFPRLPSRTHEIFSLSSVVVNGDLYVAGGNQGFKENDLAWQFYDNPRSKLTNKFWKYDPESNSWKMLASMTMKRSNFALVHIDGNIYAIGGESQYGTVTTSVECYNIEDDEWKYVAPMLAAYNDPSVVVLGGKILMYGRDMDYFGKCTNSYSLEMYDPTANVWKKVASEKFQIALRNTPILTVQGGVCYRICRKLEKGEKLHDNPGKWHISRIDTRECRNGRMSAVIQKAEDQATSFEYEYAFCINDKVFLYLSNTYVYNTGITAAEAKTDLFNDATWRQSFLALHESVVTFTFDLLKLYKTQS